QNLRTFVKTKKNGVALRRCSVIFVYVDCMKALINVDMRPATPRQDLVLPVVSSTVEHRACTRLKYNQCQSTLRTSEVLPRSSITRPRIGLALRPRNSTKTDKVAAC